MKTQCPNATPSLLLLDSVPVVRNTPLCREHFRLTFETDRFPEALPGQFVHLNPTNALDCTYHSWDESAWGMLSTKSDVMTRQPLLRRAFSIAGLHRIRSAVELDVIYRVVGTGTRWLSSLAPGDRVSLLGPLGGGFPLSMLKRRAWMVAGGVGLPPMLFLAERLCAAGKQTTLLFGAQSVDLIPIALAPYAQPDHAARTAYFCSTEPQLEKTPLVISTDDGSFGFSGHVGAALDIHFSSSGISASDLVVYTCGPERMMRFVAQFCVARGIECHVCVEREMACALATCQSCVVPLHDSAARDGWRYALCCTEGPVFEASRIVWDDPQAARRSHQP